jgi:hypothetical protein
LCDRAGWSFGQRTFIFAGGTIDTITRIRWPMAVLSRATHEGPKMAAKKKAAKNKVATKTIAKRKSAAKRELVDSGSNKLFVRRNARGTSFKEVVDVGRSLAADRRQHSKTVAKPGQGDKGDRRRR